MTSSPSMARRAVLAIVLRVGFYLLALAIAFGLLFVPYAENVYADRLHLKLAAVQIIGALAILCSVLPRFDKFNDELAGSSRGVLAPPCRRLWLSGLLACLDSRRA